MNPIGNYAKHAPFWDWGGYDREPEHEYWHAYAQEYGTNVLIPMCALGETGAYMASRGMTVTGFDITPEMVAEGQKRFGDIPNLRLCQGDVTDFHFDIAPANFCFSMDFGHILSIQDIHKALTCIRTHLRAGGGLVIETTLPPTRSYSYPRNRFFPKAQPYPGLKVWKTGEGRFEAETGRHYIAQTFYIENEAGAQESFDHVFYLQSYSRAAWLAAFEACGFALVGEYNSREIRSWQSADESFRIFEVRKKNGDTVK